MSNIFIAALIFISTNTVDPISQFKANEEEMVESILATGADDMVVGCFTEDEAALLLVD